ncbi:MAG TPA: DUF362 domain-containing protein [Phycisphaerae bacterium]|nr:DUF362 domain-containing protein [Phycisphaerae bacterium]HNU43677.1 DUF362 domain-containing protein [Phycisphaerae bacterium]
MTETHQQVPPAETGPGRQLSRREFLLRGGTTVAAATATAGLAVWLHDDIGTAGLAQPRPATIKNYFAAVDYPESAPRVSIVRDARDRVDGMVGAALAPLGGIERFVRKGDCVLIKPNVGFERDPRLGATTHPEVVRSVIRLCRRAGARRVLVTDNPIEQAAACFARTGIRAVADQEGARVVLPVERYFQPVAVRPTPPDPARNEALGTWPILWAPLEQADKVIGIAPIKDHNLCSASMLMKNWYGLLGGRRNQFHQAIHDVISDLGLLVSPTLVIADGLRVLIRNGPTGGSLNDVRPAHTLVAAVDQVACDAWCYENLLQRDPTRLRYLELAHRKFGLDAYSQSRRFGRHDWREYERTGLLVEQDLSNRLA